MLSLVMKPEQQQDEESGNFERDENDSVSYDKSLKLSSKAIDKQPEEKRVSF